MPILPPPCNVILRFLEEKKRIFHSHIRDSSIHLAVSPQPRIAMLSNVTLVASDAPNIELTMRSLDICRARCNFGDTVLFTEATVAPQAYSVVAIPQCNSRNENGLWWMANMYKYINTSHVLRADWDSWVIYPEAFTHEMLEYDYIGASWPWRKPHEQVGSGGFMFMSKKFLEVLAKPEILEHLAEQARSNSSNLLVPNVEGDFALDDYMCRGYRPTFEKEYGIRFAPTALADQFAYERKQPEAPSFGFHGIFNFWRHVDDSEMKVIAEKLHKIVVVRQEYVELLFTYYNMKKFDVFSVMLNRLGNTVPDIHAHLARYIAPDKRPMILNTVDGFLKKSA